MSTLFQPSIPEPTGTITEAELNFIEDEPSGIFPENRNSNWGLVRRLWAENIQELIDQLDVIYAERFVQTATEHLDEWESQMGVPTTAVALTNAQRRSVLHTRLKKGAFTRPLFNVILENYISATFGTVAQLNPSGLALDAVGLPLYAEADALSAFYRIYEDHANHNYDIWIRNDTTPDIPSLTRELNRIVPAGWTFVIDNTKANILDYVKASMNLAPSGYWQIGASFNDASGFGFHGTTPGGVPAAVASPGLLNAAIGGLSGARDFDGVDDYVLLPVATGDGPISAKSPFTWEAWINVGTLPANHGMILSGGLPYFSVRSTGALTFAMSIDGAQNNIDSAAGLIVPGTIYHVAAVWDGMKQRIYRNGVLVAEGEIFSPADTPGTTQIAIGRHGTSSSFYYDGVIDEPNIHSRPLSISQILRKYKTGINVG